MEFTKIYIVKAPAFKRGDETAFVPACAEGRQVSQKILIGVADCFDTLRTQPKEFFIWHEMNFYGIILLSTFWSVNFHRET